MTSARHIIYARVLNLMGVEIIFVGVGGVGGRPDKPARGYIIIALIVRDNFAIPSPVSALPSMIVKPASAATLSR